MLFKHKYPFNCCCFIYKVVEDISMFCCCIYNHRTTKTNQKYPSVNL